MEKGEEKSGNHGLMDLIKWPLTSIKNRILYCVQANYGAWARRTFSIAWTCARLPGSVKLSGLHPNTAQAVSRRGPSQASCVQVRIQTGPKCVSRRLPSLCRVAVHVEYSESATAWRTSTKAALERPKANRFACMRISYWARYLIHLHYPYLELGPFLLREQCDRPARPPLGWV